MDKKLTVLSCGAGQDTSTLIYKYVYDYNFRKTFAPNDFIVIMSDTGDEHPETYTHVEYLKKLCVDNNIKFFMLTNDMGYHYDKWPSLRGFYDRTSTVGSKAFMKTCTDKLKIQPIYKFLEDYVAKNYGFISGRKKALKDFALKYGKINVIIGIAKGEESRVADPDSGAKWMSSSINRIYPLIDLGLDREGCQEYIKSINEPLPIPSNCMLCPHMSEQELVWLNRFHPEDFNDWARIEKNKIENNRHMENVDGKNKNVGVWGKLNKDKSTMMLNDVLLIAQNKYNHWDDDQLNDYKMSHGHCVTSKY